MSEDLTSTGRTDLTALDSLAMQAQMFVQNARMNLLQLGRVLTEAKPLVAHGEWEAWVKTNAQMSTRAAQQYMQAYARFGLDPEIARLGTAKTTKLLPLTDEELGTLFSDHDVEHMTTRELDEAIRNQREKMMEEARAEVRSEITLELAARIVAEQKAQAAESRPPEVPKEMSDRLTEYAERVRKAESEKDSYKETIELQKQSIHTLMNEQKEDSERRWKLEEEVARLRRENEEQAELLEEQQTDYDRIQAELLNVKSSIAKGDAERVPLDQLTTEAFASAVRTFIGTCARMPHMASTFSMMSTEEKRDYDELLRTMEAWAADSRKALDNVVIDGGGVWND